MPRKKKEYTAEEAAAYKAAHEADLAARAAAKRAEREERKRKHALLSKLPKDVPAAAADIECAPPPQADLPAVPASEIVEQSAEAARVERGRKAIEGFYEECLNSPELNVRDKLIAAGQWAKSLGLEKQKIEMEVSQAEAWVKQVRAVSAAAPMPWERKG